MFFSTDNDVETTSHGDAELSVRKGKQHYLFPNKHHFWVVEEGQGTGQVDWNPPSFTIDSERTKAKLVSSPRIDPYDKGYFAMTRGVVQQYNLEYGPYKCTLFEKLPGGEREAGGHVRFEEMKLLVGADALFYNCSWCFRTQSRNFGKAGKTPFPGRVTEKDPNLPCVGAGSCGCTVCNGCILHASSEYELSTFRGSDGEKWIPCINCGYQKAFHEEFRLWAVSSEVFDVEHLVYGQENAGQKSWSIDNFEMVNMAP